MCRKVFLDCGGHSGCSVRKFLETIPETVAYEIHPFEPNPSCHHLFLNLVDLHNIAVSDSEGESDLFISPGTIPGVVNRHQGDSFNPSKVPSVATHLNVSKPCSKWFIIDIEFVRRYRV